MLVIDEPHHLDLTKDLILRLKEQSWSGDCQMLHEGCDTCGEPSSTTFFTATLVPVFWSRASHTVANAPLPRGNPLRILNLWQNSFSGLDLQAGRQTTMML